MQQWAVHLRSLWRYVGSISWESTPATNYQRGQVWALCSLVVHGIALTWRYNVIESHLFS